MKKILVFRGGALGDFIVTLPALALLRRQWPAARIELSGNQSAAQLAVNRKLLDAVHSQHEARWAGLYGDAPLLPEFAAWLAEFDLIISFWPDPDGDLRRRFPLHVRQCFLSGAALPERNPAAAHYCEPLRALGIEPWTCFYPLAAHELGNRILVHPGSGSPRKNWPSENWRTLLDQLPRPVSLILGAAEHPEWATWKGGARCLHRAGLTAGEPKPDEDIGLHLKHNSPAHEESRHLVNRPLEQLVSQLSRCRLFLGHDSGISHLAAACGARCVLLFGPTEPACWAPPAPNVQVLRNRSDLASLSVDVVRDAVLRALSDQR